MSRLNPIPFILILFAAIVGFAVTGTAHGAAIAAAIPTVLSCIAMLIP